MRPLTLFALLVAALAVALGAARPAVAQVTPFYATVTAESGCEAPFVYGVVLDEHGEPLVGVPVAGWFIAPDGGYRWERRTVSGSAPEVGPSGWRLRPTDPQTGEALLGSFYLSVGTYFDPQSPPVETILQESCNDPARPNRYNVTFRRYLTDPALRPYPPIVPGTSEAPPVQPGARCRAFDQAAGNLGRFHVCDDANARFLSAFERHGLQAVGYPISTRYRQDGFIVQAFQKAIFQWRPESGQVAFVNIFDEMSAAGLDPQLLTFRQTPPQVAMSWFAPPTFEEEVRLRQALLNERPALRSAYFAARDPLLFFGLPTSEVEDMGNHYAIRLQRAVLQEWKVAVPWARPGQVTIANGGDIAKEFARIPLFATIPDP